MTYHVPENLHTDLDASAIVHAAGRRWTPSPQPGVERQFLERDGGEVARASSLVRYAAGSEFPPHIHAKGEEYLVLSGVFSDEHGDFEAGTYVRNPPGSTHAPFTRDGCIIFVKLRQMTDNEEGRLVIPASEMEFRETAIAGVSRALLFDNEKENVAIETYGPGLEWRARKECGGEEMFVLDGALLYGDLECCEGTWLRMPPSAEQPVKAPSGARVWVKRGHLRAG